MGGETIVTFTISDGVDWTRKQLRLTVNAVNDKPTFVVNPDLSPVTIEGVSGGQAVVGNLSVTEDPGGIEVEQRVARWATRINAGTDSFNSEGQAIHIAAPGDESGSQDAALFFDLSYSNPQLFTSSPSGSPF